MTATAQLSAPPARSTEPSIYTRSFWLAYAANLALVTANSLTFRFADYVEFFGGSKALTGSIVQAGLIAAIAFRLVLGRAIDRHGPRRVWLACCAVFGVGCLAYLSAERVSWVLWMARISQQVGVAGMFTCSIVNIQDQVPPHRRTEVIGSLGSSGFIGTVLGTNLGDLIFRLLPDGRAPFIATFGTTLVGGLLHTLLVLVLTRRECHISPPQSPNPWSLLWRHWPGPVVWVSLAMGTSFAITTVFLSRFASAAGLGGIAMFFLPYSLVAFACRWWMRDWGQRLGRHKMVLWGLTGLAAGQLLLLAVRSTAWLIPAGSACGFGHALLFPAVVSLGAGRFPSEYRGTGTTLVLGFQEIGLAIAAPLLGLLIDRGTLRQGTPDPSDGPGAGLLGYDLAFLVSAAVAVVSGVWYVLTAARHPDHDGQPLATVGHGPVVEAETDQGDLVVVSTE